MRIFDCPTKPVDVNSKARTRVCVEGMVKLVRELDPGTVAHLEVGGGRSLYASQSCFVQGAASGQWLGVLVSHGLDVRLVAASTWKWALKRTGRLVCHKTEILFVPLPKCMLRTRLRASRETSAFSRRAMRLHVLSQLESKKASTLTEQTSGQDQARSPLMEYQGSDLFAKNL